MSVGWQLCVLACLLVACCVSYLSLSHEIYVSFLFTQTIISISCQLLKLIPASTMIQLQSLSSSIHHRTPRFTRSTATAAIHSQISRILSSPNSTQSVAQAAPMVLVKSPNRNPRDRRRVMARRTSPKVMSEAPAQPRAQNFYQVFSFCPY